MSIKKIIIFACCTVFMLSLIGCEKDIVITDIPTTQLSFKPIQTSIYQKNIKPYSRFSQTKTTNLKSDIYLTQHMLGKYSIYNKTNKLVLWDSDISFKGEWFEDGILMPYGLFTPSDFCEYDDLPLIVYLHGSGSKTKTAEHFMTHGVQKLFTEWPYEGFRAYIVVPQLARGFNSGSWKNATSKSDLQMLLDYLLENYNIDRTRIYVMGHSLGGQGAMYMAHQMPDYFAACVSLSPYSPGVDMADLKIPLIAYLGYDESGEDERCVKYAAKLEKLFGTESITFFNCTHGEVPLRTFALDENKNNRSDVLEWLFQNKKEYQET